jgi:hypothetical protein
MPLNPYGHLKKLKLLQPILHYIHKPLFCVVLFLPFCSRAQKELDSLQQRFDTYQQQALQEKVFVHTDKNFYLAGETLWFKIYCVDGYQHRPMPLEKAAYVEIINTAHKPVLQTQMALQNGSGSGSFQLPSFINSGTYLLRAYTSWMKNGTAESFFETSITIVNTQRRPDWQTLQPPLTPDVQFFPEGGNLVQGLESMVGFKVADRSIWQRHGCGRGCDKCNERYSTALSHRPFRHGPFSIYTATRCNIYRRNAAGKWYEDFKIITAGV